MNTKTPGKKVAIVQSSYIPWKGYFDLINQVDEFILFDDVQYTKRDWRSRNAIKTPNGTQWLTVPVVVKGKYHQLIKDTQVADPHWHQKHWAAIKHNYSKAPHFADYAKRFHALYLACEHEPYLSQINYSFIAAICQLLNIQTRLTWSMDYSVTAEAKTDKLIALCKAAGASYYLSGPAAQSYIDPEEFKQNDIELGYMDYSGYPEYPQLYQGMVHQVSILDLIFNCGENALNYMKSSNSH